MRGNCLHCEREVSALQEQDYETKRLRIVCSCCGNPVVVTEYDEGESAPPAAPVVTSPLKPAQPLVHADILSTARERLNQVQAKIKELRSLEREERMLTAMIAAAEGCDG